MARTSTNIAYYIALEELDITAISTDSFFRDDEIGCRIQVANLDVLLHTEVSEYKAQIFSIDTGGFCVNNSLKKTLISCHVSSDQFREMTVEGKENIIHQFVASPNYHLIQESTYHTHDYRGPLELENIVFSAMSIPTIATIYNRSDYQEILVDEDLYNILNGLQLELTFVKYPILNDGLLNYLRGCKSTDDCMLILSDTEFITNLPPSLILEFMKLSTNDSKHLLFMYTILKSKKSIPFSIKKEALRIYKDLK